MSDRDATREAREMHDSYTAKKIVALAQEIETLRAENARLKIIDSGALLCRVIELEALIKRALHYMEHGGNVYDEEKLSLDLRVALKHAI